MRSDCAIAGTLDLIGDRWSLLIVRDLLFQEELRFADLAAAAEGYPRTRSRTGCAGWKSTGSSPARHTATGRCGTGTGSPTAAGISPRSWTPWGPEASGTCPARAS